MAPQTIQTLDDGPLTRRIQCRYPYGSVYMKLAEVRKVSLKKEPTPTTNYPNVDVVRGGRGVRMWEWGGSGEEGRLRREREGNDKCRAIDASSGIS